MDPTRTADAIRYGASRGGSGILVRGGRRVGSWGDHAAKYDLKSTTKSFGSILLGLAIRDGLVTIDTKVRPILPELGVSPPGNAATSWLPLITVRHLATHTAGFAKKGGFEPLQFEPGTAWFYSDGGPNWLADLLTVRYGGDLRTVFRARVLTPMGIGPDQLVWRRNHYRPPTLRGIERREFGSGIWTSVDVMARLGLMLLRDGRGEHADSARGLPRLGRRPPGLPRCRAWTSKGAPVRTSTTGCCSGTTSTARSAACTAKRILDCHHCAASTAGWPR